MFPLAATDPALYRVQPRDFLPYSSSRMFVEEKKTIGTVLL